MKIAKAQLPKITRENRKTLPPKVVSEATADLADSFDYAPHAYTDGTEYETYSEALSTANLTIREASEAMGIASNMFRRRVWDTTGNKDRKKKGKYVFAVTQRTSPPKPRNKTPEAQAA